MMKKRNNRRGAERRLREAFARGEALENTASLRDQRHTAGGDTLGRKPGDLEAEDFDRAAACGQQADGNVQAGRFTRSVAAEQPEQPAFAERKRDLLQYMAVAVISLDVAQAKRATGQDKPLWCADRQRPRPASLPRLCL